MLWLHGIWSGSALFTSRTWIYHQHTCQWTSSKFRICMVIKLIGYTCPIFCHFLIVFQHTSSLLYKSLSKGEQIVSFQNRTLILQKHAYSNILKILPPKNENFQIKCFDIFHISAQNIDCGYSLEPPHWGGSNDYPQSMFWAEIRKIMYTPVNPSFTI